MIQALSYQQIKIPLNLSMYKKSKFISKATKIHFKGN